MRYPPVVPPFITGLPNQGHQRVILADKSGLFHQFRNHPAGDSDMKWQQMCERALFQHTLFFPMGIN